MSDQGHADLNGKSVPAKKDRKKASSFPRSNPAALREALTVSPDRPW